MRLRGLWGIDTFNLGMEGTVQDVGVRWRWVLDDAVLRMLFLEGSRSLGRAMKK